MEKEFKVELGFVQRVLPWIIGAVALGLYLATLNHSATFAGLAKLAQVAGWDWRPTVVQPLHFLVTLPVRWLPAGWQLVALNLLSAVCSALTIYLLARSVALLPHDRTREQRQIERNEFSLLSMKTAWLPPVMAALVCGLQLSFWENAVVATGESLDLLVFAWLIHGLLQYRLDQKESRLSWFAFVYGLSITNNFAMVAFLPAFVVAMAWIKGAGFFNWRFLLRLAALGLAGLLGYLILPTVNVLKDSQGFGFWELLGTHLSFQKNNLQSFPRYLIVLLSFTSVLPVLFMGIRWPAQFGDISPTGNALTILMTHVIHGVFLVACLYVAFDPQFSPRSLGGGRFLLLPLYYLGALSIGYCMGYFLLVFGSKPPPQIWRQLSVVRRASNPVVFALIWIALVAVPTGLVVKNLPVVWANTGTALGRLAAELASSLPPGNSLVLSDDPFRLYALRWELEKGNRRDAILIDTAALIRPIYHRYLNRQFPERWPQVPIEEQSGVTVDNQVMVGILRTLGQRDPIYYLHPSFGYYFEYFYQKPTNLVYRMLPYTTNALSAPPMTAEELRAQEAYWQALRPKELDRLVGKAPPFTPPRKAAKSQKPIDTMEGEVAKMYSRSLNHFGVELQRAAEFKKARDYFDLALKLNDANASAFINRDYNQQFQAGRPAGDQPSEGATNRLAAFAGVWDALLALNGPVDEPSVSFLMAEVFSKAGSPRQAAEQLQRVLFFTPDNVAARVALASICAQIPLPDKALELAAAVRAQAGTNGLTEAQMMTLVEAEAWSHTFKTNIAAADQVLREARMKHPGQIIPWTTQVEIYLRLNRSQDALELLGQQLQAQPTNTVAMVNYACVLMQNQRFTNAIAYLDRALQLRPRMPEALLNRAIASLRSERLDAALSDYTELGKVMSNPSHEVYYGLGEVHFLKKNKKLALENYERYLKLAPAGLPERRFIEDRIKTLEAGEF